MRAKISAFINLHPFRRSRAIVRLPSERTRNQVENWFMDMENQLFSHTTLFNA
ncbi:MAG: hypothetical protein HC780_04250 [Leptolyngbyaceae cyanobacterium CSU_1_3]|nr:hypothetical protein [Leptolyngbyaceae cyanobacterium CSU_1_3]